MIAATCFSGIGAPEIAMPHWQWLWHAEIEKFPAAVMAARHKGSINLGDVTADDFMQRATSFGQIDVLAGGPPCQAFSVAGLRKSMADDRGNLSLRFVRIAHAVRPRNLLVENVPGWLNTPDNAFGCFLGAILGHDDALHSPADGKWPRCGMATGPLGRLCWATLDAQFFGVAQRRRRVFVVVDFGNGADPAAVLFEPQGLLGHTPPRRKKGQGVAGAIARSTFSGGAGGRPESAAVNHFVAQVHDPNERLMATLDASMDRKWGSNQWVESEQFVYAAVNNDAINQAVFGIDNGNGACSGDDAIGTLCSDSPSGGGRPLPAIAFSSKDYGNDATEDLAPTLRSMNHSASHANGGGQMAVAFDMRGREGGAQFEGPHETAAIRAASGGSSKSYIATQGVAWSIMPMQSGTNYKARETDVAQPIMAGGPVGGNQGGDYVQQGWAVRRLTPVECERLQGFPDDFTNIEYRGKPAADGPRYKALGNSWAVPVGRWILERIERFMPEPAA